jgi:hypothetical protein
MTQVYYEPPTKKPIDKTSIIILVVCLFLAIGAGIFAYKLSQDVVKTWTITDDLPGAPVVAGAVNADGSTTERLPPRM